jgi:hypothetical protein
METRFDVGQLHGGGLLVGVIHDGSRLYPSRQGSLSRLASFDAVVAEYQRLLEAYPLLGYEVTILPKIGVSERADFVLNRLP